MKRKNSFSSTEASFDSLMENLESENSHKDNYEESVNKPKNSFKQSNSTHSVPECNDEDDDEFNETELMNDSVTTLRMLFEKCQSADIEFYDSCMDVGLLSDSSIKCQSCDFESDLVDTSLLYNMEIDTTSVDNLWRQCPNCKIEWSIRRDSWCLDIKVPLKELVLIVYCWCRGFNESQTCHELEMNINSVQEVFTKCSCVAEDYFRNSISNIGGSDKIIIGDIFTYNNRRILGLSEKDTGDVFFSLLNTSTSDNEILTLIIDNIHEGSTIVSKTDSQLLQSLDEECVSYMKQNWCISIDKTESISTDSLVLQWSHYEHCLPPTDILDPQYINVNLHSLLRLSLLKMRLKNANDCFLFFLNIISQLYKNNS